jgi:hypothetical protein
MSYYDQADLKCSFRRLIEQADIGCIATMTAWRSISDRQIALRVLRDTRISPQVTYLLFSVPAIKRLLSFYTSMEHSE